MPANFDFDRPIFGRVRLEHLLHLSVLAIAVVLRLGWLGVRPLHHDESIHAYFSWRILTVGPSDYHYDPVYHGPALYYLTALFEGLLGPSDFSARLLGVTTGFGLIALAWPLRSLIGRREALLYAILLTVSPTLGYYSRSLRHDVPIAFFTLAAVVAFLHFVRSGRRRHAYWAGVAIGFAAATKEDIYLSAFILANALWIVGFVPAAEAGPGGLAGARRWAREVLAFLARAWMPLATAVLIALTIAVTLYTSLLSRPEDWNATARALHYWWGQQEIQRIGGPWWYYLPLEVGYESMIFFPALVTLGRVARGGARSRIEVMFVSWMGLAFLLYAWAQEKVPWLLVPVLLPQVVASACTLARLSRRGLLAWAPLFAFTVWSLVASNYLYDAPRTSEPAADAHFEPIVYVQSTYDIPRVVAEIASVARHLRTGRRTPIVVTGNATWPLSWYLRDYAVHWNSLPAETSAPVLVVDPEEAARLKAQLGDRYAATRFAVRGWWEIDWSRMTPRALLRFLFERRVWNPTGTTDAVLFVAKNLRPESLPPPVRLIPAPTPLAYSGSASAPTGRVIGSPGTAPGELESPRGLALDGDGDLLVADSGNNRIQKLSPDGHPLAVWGGPNPGDGPRQFRQPCGVAAARDGSIYVADTWNHRIQKLDGDGRYVLEWRERNPGFWGPRAVAVAPDGTVFVADTGNKRILAYDPNGRSLFAFGGEGVEPGQLVEPVGLAIDPEGQVLYVADTGNHRVQAFGLDGTPRYAWPAYGWQEFYTEPYLAWQGGTLWATDSFNHRVNGYGPLGRLRSSIGGLRSTPFGRPIGIAAAPDGRLYVTDFAQDHIVVLDGEGRADRSARRAAPVELFPSSPTIHPGMRPPP